MATVLPPLTTLIDQGAAGGHEFERLMHQLLIEDGKRHGYSYEPVSGPGGDGGIDGWVARGLPGFQGPVAFQFKWLWEDLHKGSNKAQIQDSFQSAALHSRDATHWVLVTPLDLKTSEQKWLAELGTTQSLRIHHWGQVRIENLLRGFPALFARYYPHEAQSLPGGQGSVDFREFALSYRQKVELACRHLRLLGLPPETLREQDGRKDVLLRELFIPLNFESEEHGREAIQPLGALLANSKSTVVLGDPGTGKTTLLSFISLLLLGKAELTGYTSPKTAMPLLIPLRQFVRAAALQPSFSFIDYLVAQAHSDHALKNAHPFFFEAALRMGEAFVLFDGLDEVGSATTRRRISAMIQAFRAEYPACPIWVTSRIYGYTRDVQLPGSDFLHARLGRLNDSQVQDFIHRWYVLQLPNNERERREATESLLKAVQHTPSVRRLAGNPLLLTLMAFIHQGLRKLPQDRGELYEKCVEMLLKTWQEARRGEEAPAPAFTRLGLHLQTQKDYLAHLALYVQEKNQQGSDENSRGLISRREALERLTARHLAQGRRERPHLTAGEAREEMSDFLDYISDQTGLLIDRGGDQLSFIHLSFQEYLAAWVFTCEPKEHDNLRFFTTYLGRQSWEEVLLLRLYIVLRAPGGGGTRDFDAIVEEIRRKLEQGGPPLGWLTLVRALRDNLKFSPGDQDVILQKAIEGWSESSGEEREAWFAALNEVKLFSGEAQEKLASASAKERLRELLDEVCEHGRPVSAIACLHLRMRLFGWPDVGVARLSNNPGLPEMLPDLVAFLDESGVNELLGARSKARDWLAALGGLDGRRVYGLSLAWALGVHSPSEQALRAATERLGSKVISDLRSRKAFAAGHERNDAAELFQRPGQIISASQFYDVDVPLAAFQARDVVPSYPVYEQAVRFLDHSMLAQEQFKSDQWEASIIEKILRGWAGKYIGELLRPFHSGGVVFQDFVGVVVRAFVHAFGHDFGRDSGRAFGRDFVRDFGSDFGRNFGRDFGRAFVRTFGRDFGSNFIRAFGSDYGSASLGSAFGRAFGRDFVRDFSHDFGSNFDSNFIGAFGGDFARDFVRTFSSAFDYDFDSKLLRDLGVDPKAQGWERKWRRALSNEETLALILRSNLFWRGPLFRNSPVYNVQLEPGKMTTALKNPLALPLLMADLFGTGLVNYLYSLGRHLAVISPSDNKWTQAIDEWIRQNPADVYWVALAWEEYAESFQSQRGSLTGAAGALMLVHAAYASLMTGIAFEGHTWINLLKTRDHQDPLIHGAYLLHELAHFRDVEQNVRAWEALPVKFLPEEPAPVARQHTGEQRAVAPPPTVLSASSPSSRPALGPELLFAWAHLSDIHWGHGGAGHRADQKLVLSALEQDISKQLGRGLPRPDALLVTGDIAFSGEQAQYGQAREWLLQLASKLSLDHRHVFTVPGNHDVQRAADKDRNIARMVRALRAGSDDLDEVLVNDTDRAQLGRRMTDYLAFAARLAPACLGSDTLSLAAWSHRLDARGGLRVRLVGLNTALLAADDLDKGKLRLGTRALEQGLAMLPEDNEIIVVLSHHPLRDDWLADGRKADRWLQGRAHIHLFGHVHTPDLEETRSGSGQKLLRIAAGAVHGDRKPEGVPAGHGYSLAALYAHQEKELLLRVWPRVWSDNNTGFRPDVHNINEDRGYAEHVIAGIKLAKPA